MTKTIMADINESSIMIRCQIYAYLALTLRKPDEKCVQTENSLYANLKNIIDGKGHDYEKELEKINDMRLAFKPDELLSEFNRLFESHGGMAAPPFETEYTKETPQHTLSQSAELADIAGFYKAFGLQMSLEGKERCDHIAVQLEFMHFLVFKELMAIYTENSEHWEIVIKAQGSFMESHLMRWPVGFLTRLEETRASSYYLKAGGLTVDWIERDKKYLQDIANLFQES